MSISNKMATSYRLESVLLILLIQILDLQTSECLTIQLINGNYPIKETPYITTKQGPLVKSNDDMNASSNDTTAVNAIKDGDDMNPAVNIQPMNASQNKDGDDTNPAVNIQPMNADSQNKDDDTNPAVNIQPMNADSQSKDGDDTTLKYLNPNYLPNPIDFLRPLFSKFRVHEFREPSEDPSNADEFVNNFHFNNHISSFFRKPAMFLEQLGQKGAAILGTHGSIFGSGYFAGNKDYPFAYRSVRTATQRK